MNGKIQVSVITRVNSYKLLILLTVSIKDLIKSNLKWDTFPFTIYSQAQ